MSYAVKILPPADSDSIEAALWYDDQLPGLGEEFLNEVNSVAEKLKENPELYSIRFADIRRAPLQRFKSYGLYYLIQGSEVWVIAVHHGMRHPRWLQKRRGEIG